MTEYDKMTREELIKRLEQMGEEYCQQADQVEADNHMIADLQNRVFELETELSEARKGMAQIRAN